MNYTTRATLPAFMHFAHANTRFTSPFTRVLTGCRLGAKVLLVRGALRAHRPECTCLMCWPDIGPLPQIEHSLANCATPFVQLAGTPQVGIPLDMITYLPTKCNESLAP
jgi:hypothetical protein